MREWAEAAISPKGLLCGYVGQRDRCAGYLDDKVGALVIKVIAWSMASTLIYVDFLSLLILFKDSNRQ